MKQILIVEDDITMNRMLSNILLAEGYKVTSAHTVTEAQHLSAKTITLLGNEVVEQYRIEKYM